MAEEGRAAKGHDTRTERSIAEVNWFAWGRRNTPIIGRDKRPGPRDVQETRRIVGFFGGGNDRKRLGRADEKPLRLSRLYRAAAIRLRDVIERGNRSGRVY